MKVNHTLFNYLAIVATGILVTIVITNGSADANSVLSLFTGIMMNVALFLGIAFGLQFFQMGIGTDVTKEIYNEHNIAAAIYQAGLFMALAIVIAKGLM